ncbi:hypothetical protein [Desulfatirhabdium butyrativorans]|uniref:hypothetical protein n=1 Tax=Desulfatirhabdium butyrativorans TaxID=340467 RepID=UPI0004035143|nr:hypothetical protein [Desulfatirhabdium butyrativorans]
MEKQPENLQQDSMKEVLGAIKEALIKAKQWKIENLNADQIPEILSNQFDKLHDVLSDLGEHTDFNNVLPAYLNMAKFFSNHVDQNMIFSLGAAIVLCHEAEIGKLVAAIKKDLLKVTVHYRKANPFSREVQVFFNRDGKPAEFNTKQAVSRDDLPADVREEFLRTEKDVVSINLYPEEA